MTHHSQHVSINFEDSRRCQLLVSVRNAQEAHLCLASGVDWIDLKEPAAGSLGMPSLHVTRQVFEVLEGHSRRSVALGELSQLLEAGASCETAVALSQYFPICKVGLSGMQHDPNWSDKLRELSEAISGNLTPVIYADWNRCSAPEPKSVVQWAMDQSCPYLLIDTYCKDGRRLLDYLDSQQLEEIIDRASESETAVLFAGSLALADVPVLIELSCAALAVRGAVCHGERKGAICPERLRTWVQTISTENQRSQFGKPCSQALRNPL